MQSLEFLPRQRPPLRLGKETGGLLAVVRVAKRLLLGHGHEISLHGAARQFGLHIGLATAEHHRLQPAAQFGKVLVVDRPAALVEFVEVAVKAEQWTDQLRVEVLHDRIELVDAVLDWRAGQNEGKGRAQRLHPSRRLDLPVLDALCLVEHHHVRMQ